MKKALPSVLAMLWLVLLAIPVQANDQPNILILMAEDLGLRVGAFGDPVANTPNIDRLAEQGTRFPNTFTAAGVCAPSRAAHITGMHQVAIGAQHMRTRSFKPNEYRAVPPPEVKAYPELLRAAGYYTLTNNKLDYQFSNYGAGSGPFTIWDYEGDDPDWNRRAQGQPFFALINFGMTHESRMFAKNVKIQRAKGWKQVTDPAAVGVPPYYPDTPAIRQDIAQHYDNIHEMDREVGTWLTRLEADGLLENTIVIWTTDHGDGLPRGKRELYDSGIKVPLVLRWPVNLRPRDKAPGSGDSRLVSFVDFGPSVLAWAGVEVPDYMHGKPVLADPAVSREYVFASKDRLDEMPFRERVVRDSRYKYLYNYQPGEVGAKPLAYREQLATMADLREWFESGRMNDQQAAWFRPRPQEEFYDLQNDPHEVNNLADDPAYADELARLRHALARWRERVPDLSDEPEAQMAERFWPGGEQPVTRSPRLIGKDGFMTITCPTEGASIGYRVDGGGWQLYSEPFKVTAGALVEAKSVRYGWRESMVTSIQGDGQAYTAIPLDDPALRVQGLRFTDVGRDRIRFARFDPETLKMNKAQLGFNPAKAHNPAGGAISFVTASTRIRLAFRPLEGLNRGSEFGIFANGKLVSSKRFGPKEEVLSFVLDNPNSSQTNWLVTLPTFAEVELVSLETDPSFGLLPAQDPGRGKFVALGDSITHGTGQGSATNLTWPFLLSRKLDMELYNLAVGGSGVAGGAANILHDFEGVDLVTILFGYNDWNGEGDSVDEFTNQYRQLLREVRAAQPGAVIVCISPLVTRRETSKSSGLGIEGFRNALQELVMQRRQSDPRIHFIDGRSVSSFANLQPEGSKDVVHLTVEGAAMLAEDLFPRISDILE
jgi:arylsulfatase A-like enzyme/lysophospholipase L1-like esterase